MSLTGSAATERVLHGKINRLEVLTLSAYEIAVREGFRGTVEEWLDSLNGGLITVDKQLYRSGHAADAKVTGDAVRTLAGNDAAMKQEIATEKERIDNLLGGETTDGELLDVRIGHDGAAYTNAGAAVRGQMSEVYSSRETDRESQRLEGLSGGHLHKIHVAQNQTMRKYSLTGDVIGENGTVTGSGYIACPRFLGMAFPDESARAYVYFYNLVDGEYVPRWDIIAASTSTGVMNYLNSETARPYLFEIPEGVYMQVRKAVGEVEFYGWDGEAFGMSLSADYNIPKADGGNKVFHTDGSYGITIPGSAEFVLCHSGQSIWVILGFVGTESTLVFNSYAKNFVKLPEGYDFFRARMVSDEGMKSVAGDMSGLVSVVVESREETPSEKALKILENCKKVCSIRWTPKRNVKVKSDTNPEFIAGVQYMGIPYGSGWKKAHFVGWHVSPHTFVNAVNDEDSIFYNERMEASGAEAPYYSNVCTSFAAMCAGWPYPQPNYGFLYDPMVELHHSPTPPIGAVYAHLDAGGSHAVIPERIDHLKNDIAVSAYECIRPVSQRSTRYGAMAKSDAIDVYHTSYGDGYYDEYAYVANHWLADPDMAANVPYIDTDTQIVGGGARPYKGDRCVYTSEEAVKINIKDTEATALYLMRDGEEPKVIALNGETQVDVKAYLDGDGIYFVYTNTDDTQESFEYHEVEAITYRMVNGVPVLPTQDFWYIMFMMRGDYRHSGSIATAQLPAGDYSYLTENGAVCEYVYAIFRMGVYGAYTVPVALGETVEEETGTLTDGEMQEIAERAAALVDEALLDVIGTGEV